MDIKFGTKVDSNKICYRIHVDKFWYKNLVLNIEFCYRIYRETMVLFEQKFKVYEMGGVRIFPKIILRY